MSATASQAIEIVQRDEALGEFLRAVVAVEAPGSTELDIPTRTFLTPEDRAAIIDFFSEGIDGAVVPETRRSLTIGETSEIMAERLLLDRIEAVIKERKEAIRASVFNHMDVEMEAAGETGERDRKGHYLVKSSLTVTGSGKKFTREIRSGSPSLSAEDLADLVDDPTVDFTHDDYLACTTQVRALDEVKVLQHLRKRPEIVDGIAKATKVGSSTSSLYVRKG